MLAHRRSNVPEQLQTDSASLQQDVSCGTGRQQVYIREKGLQEPPLAGMHPVEQRRLVYECEPPRR